MLEKPHVVAVMITGKDVKRYPMAMQAIESFKNQTYQNKTLLILNDNAHSLFPPEYTPLPNIKEIPIRLPLNEAKNQLKPFSLGYLRNQSIEQALKHKADYIVQWDDDDFSHPNRIKYQIENTPSKEASIFRYEIHCHLYRREFFLNSGQCHKAGGFDGTMLFPAKCEARFEEIGKAEDTLFLQELKKEVPINVLNNPSTMYLRFYHGRNTWDEKHVMRRKAGSRNLNRDEEAYARGVLIKHYEELRYL